MTTINSFLQRKRLREFNHGMYMVFAAYALSFLLLLIGSDAIYNVKSKADSLKLEPIEVNPITMLEENKSLIDPYGTTDNIPVFYQVEYRMEYRQEFFEKHQQQYQSQYLQDNQKEVLLQANTIMSFSDESLASDIIVADNTTETIKETINETSTDTSKFTATKEEIKMLERIVEAEATGEDMVGKILVANVVLNRIANDEFPDTVEGVIFQKVGGDYQFSPISDKRYWKVKITKETKEAVQRAVDGEDHSEGALFFMARKLARKSSARWFDNNLKWLFKHGGHEFYK